MTGSLKQTDPGASARAGLSLFLDDIGFSGGPTAIAHCAVRTGSGRDLLAKPRPPSAWGSYGNGHIKVTGSALQVPFLSGFVYDLSSLDAALANKNGPA
jgi:hypothetical protein